MSGATLILLGVLLMLTGTFAGLAVGGLVAGVGGGTLQFFASRGDQRE